MELKAKKRVILGKKVKHLRAEGFLPAELYGRGLTNIHLNVPAKEFAKLYKEAGENTVIDLDVDGEKRPVLIYFVDHNPVTDKITHADFYAVRMDEKITTKAPLEFLGEAPAVKEKGAILVKAAQEIEVEALPGDLPHNIKINLGSLDDIGKSLYVKDLKPLKGVKFLEEGEMVIASVNAKITEEEEAAMAAPKTVEEVKVEAEEKVEARQKDKEKTEEETASPAEKTK